METEVRRLDNLGRLVIPASIRNQLQMEKDTPCSIRVNGAKIEVEKYEPTCILCNSNANITHYKEKPICNACIYGLQEKLE